MPTSSRRTQPNTLSERAEEQQNRTRLYVQVMLIVDLLAHLSDAINPLFFDLEPPPLELTPWLIRNGVTVGAAIIWILLKTLRVPYAASVAFEVVFTIALASSYLAVSKAYAGIPILVPMFALLGDILILVVRSSLVPSTVVRTVLVGLAVLATLFVGMGALLRELDARVIDGIAFMGGAIVIATSVSSHVIYGLRQQVRDMTKLGQYVLESKLGEGGMGIVYRASHGMLRRPTAVKLLPPERSGEDEIARFEREVQLTAKLTHPNTVTVFDYGRTPEGVFYYAMELLDGATLDDVVSLTGPQSDTRILKILMASAGALEEAHDIGLIHRDIKPSNIMLCRRGGRNDVAKLLDFGLVKQLASSEPSPELTAAELILGTPLYMSPEAIRDAQSVDARSDLYALGAVGYYLLTGTHVFNANSIVEICAKHLSELPEPPSQRLGRPVNALLEETILRCLSKAPNERPTSASELAEILASIPPTEPFNATEWWDEYSPALAKLHREESISGKTLAVQR